MAWGTLTAALTALGARNEQAYRGIGWVHELRDDTIAYLCWQEGTAVSWLPVPEGIQYRDTYATGFDPKKMKPNEVTCFDLMGRALRESINIRCILARGTKQTSPKYAPWLGL